MRILDRGRLAKDTRLVESLAILRRAKGLLQKHGKRTGEVMAVVRSEIEASGVSPMTREALLAEFERMTPTIERQIEESSSLEAQVLAESEKVIQLLPRGAPWCVPRASLRSGAACLRALA